LARWQLGVVKRSRPNLQIRARYLRGTRGMGQAKKKRKMQHVLSGNVDVV